MKTIEFNIKKISYVTSENLDLSNIPMMTRRRLSSVEKLAVASMSNCLVENDVNIVFASRFGEIERSKKLISQYQTENEVSPTDFGFSVHNSSVSVFSILNKIKKSYNAISAGEYSFCYALLEAILQVEKKDVLVCYADFEEKDCAISILISSQIQEDLEKIKFIATNKDAFLSADLLNFFLNKEEAFDCGLYRLERLA